MTLLVAALGAATFPDFNKYEVREGACDIIVIVIICVLSIAFLGFGIYILVVYQGEPYPGNAQMSGSVVDAGAVDHHLLTPGSSCFSPKFTALAFENSTSCDTCYTVLQVNVTADNAALRLDSKSRSLDINTESYISFTTESEDKAMSLLSGISLCGKCILNSGSAQISATVIEYDDGEVKAEPEQVEAEPEEFDEDVSDSDAQDTDGKEPTEQKAPKAAEPKPQTRVVRETNILDETVELPAQSGVAQEISGYIVDDLGVLEGVEVSAEIPGCQEPVTTKTDGTG